MRRNADSVGVLIYCVDSSLGEAKHSSTTLPGLTAKWMCQNQQQIQNFSGEEQT